MSDRERMIYDSITDDDLDTPVSQLPPGKVAVIQHVLRGPYGEDLMRRIDGPNPPIELGEAQ